MKTIRDLAKVGARLEEAAKQSLPASAHDPPSLYEHYEMLAIQVLDSETYDYPPGALQQYLEKYLEDLRVRLNLQPL